MTVVFNDSRKQEEKVKQLIIFKIKIKKKKTDKLKCIYC